MHACTRVCVTEYVCLLFGPQAQLKKKGFPWTLAKSFIAACPFGTAFEVNGIDLQNLEIGITVSHT